MAKSRFERSWDFDNQTLPSYYLDILEHRNISNDIATTFNVKHESPQVLLIKNGECVYNNSHNSISVDDIKEKIS